MNWGNVLSVYYPRTWQTCTLNCNISLCWYQTVFFPTVLIHSVIQLFYTMQNMQSSYSQTVHMADTWRCLSSNSLYMNNTAVLFFCFFFHDTFCSGVLHVLWEFFFFKFCMQIQCNFLKKVILMLKLFLLRNFVFFFFFLLGFTNLKMH